MKKLIIILLILTLSLLYCSDKAKITISSQLVVSNDSTITLKAGETGIMLPDSLYIKFVEVIYEGRCALDVECFWEGMAEIKLQLNKPNSDVINTTVGISGSGSGEQYSALALGYKITLMELNPYPERHDQPSPLENYIATLKVIDTADIVQEVSPIILSDISYEQIQSDPFDLSEIDIFGDTLNLTVKYSGGCRQHLFNVFMLPPAFEISVTVNAYLFIRHINNNDLCEAYITDYLMFDLTPINELYKSTVGDSGYVILKVYDYFENEPDSSFSILYQVK